MMTVEEFRALPENEQLLTMNAALAEGKCPVCGHASFESESIGGLVPAAACGDCGFTTVE